MTWIILVVGLVAFTVGIVFLVKYIIKSLDRLRDRKNKNKYASTVANNQQTIITTPSVNNENVYRLKESLLTYTEKKYFECFKTILPNNFIIQPQINLATVLEKVSGSHYQNELFRNIDFGIFDLNYKPLLMVEINDETHRNPDRVDRDIKVADICFSAGLPLIRFWTSYGIDREYFIKRFRQYLDFTVT